MSQAERREEYLRLAAVRISLLSEILQLLREQLGILARPQGLALLLESRDRVYVRLEGLKDAEDQYADLLKAGLLEPVERMEALIVCRRRLAGAVAARLLELMEKQLPDSFPERKRLYFGGNGELLDRF